MKPLSDDLPKAVMPLWNRSLLARNVDLLQGWGVREILVNAHHGADQVIREAMSLSGAKCRITVSHEPEILGTGGALRRAEWFFDRTPFWLINADVVGRLDPRPLLRAFRKDRPLAALWMHDQAGPRTVEVAHGRVTNFASNHPGAPNTCTFCGLHLLSPRILRYLPDTGFASIITAYERAMKDGRRITAVTVTDAYWADVGTPERYLQAHRDTAPDVPSDVCVSPAARVGRHARLSRCVVWEGARIAPAARIDNAVIGRDTTVSGRVTGLAVKAPLALSKTEQATFRKLGWDIQDATAVMLPERGSARSFMRVADAQRSAILMRYDPARTENAYYVAQARFLARQGWPVPAVLWQDAKQNRAILEDAGDTSLTDRVQEGKPRDVTALYQQIIPRVLELHGPITRAFRRSRTPAMPGFDARLYRYERDLFTTHFLKHTLNLSAPEIRAITRDLLTVTRALMTIRPVLLHRDLQSSNIFFHRGGPVFIDFQGMRLGPAAYDLASLLCDPYVALPNALRKELLDEYAAKADPRTFRREDFAWASVQRLIQAIGAYARLGALPGCDRFLKHIPTALNLLRELLSECPGLPNLKSVITLP